MKLRADGLACLFLLVPVALVADESSNSSGMQLPLRDNLVVTEVSVTTEISLGSGLDNPASFWDGQSLRPVIYAPQPNGGAKIGWTDVVGKIHITPLNANSKRAGPDLVFDSGRLRDLVAHDDGFAILRLYNGGMHLQRVHNGKNVFAKRLISNSSRDIHMGSLAYNGERYAAYFAIHGGGHEGDSLRYVDPQGNILSGGWTWGCSHCIDMRLAQAGKRFVPLGLSDAYPGTGFYYHHTRKRVAYTWGDRRGGTGGRIGGLVALGSRTYLAFSSRDGGRRHWGVALADFQNEAPYDQTFNKYLLPDSADQLNVKLARFDSDTLLVSWLERDGWQRKFQRYDQDANPIGKPEVLPVRISPRSDLKTLESGDVVWAHTWGEDRKKLKLVRIRAPK